MDKLVILGIILALALVGPFIGIWVINTLFDLSNPYDLTHWFAMLISGIFVFGGGSS
jgi:hypothetical protein